MSIPARGGPGIDSPPVTHTVRVLNQSPAGSGERIGRLVNAESTPLLRKATLTIQQDQIRLDLVDDLGSVHEIGSLAIANLEHVDLARRAFTPGQQLVRPIVSGMLGGVVGGAILLARIGERNVRSPGASLGMILLLGLLFAAIFVVVNIKSIVWSPLSLLVIRDRDGRTLELAVADAEVERLLSPLLGRGIEVRALRRTASHNTGPVDKPAPLAGAGMTGDGDRSALGVGAGRVPRDAFWTCPECGSLIASEFSRCAGCRHVRA